MDIDELFNDEVAMIGAYGKIPDAPILGLLSAFKLTDRAIGQVIGMPRSTVQAMASGVLAERFSRAQKDRLVDLVKEIRGICDTVLDRLVERE